MSCYNSCRNGNCNKNLASNSFFSNYQRQKIIQKTVRIDSSNYTMNVGALSVYQKPSIIFNGVNWNQQSDRAFPHIQTNIVASGGNPGGNSTKRTITRCRPGALSPGGIGVDIKHNSYYRYLAKIKGKGPLRRELFSPNKILNGIPQGGKFFKTNIVNGCNCIQVDNCNNIIKDDDMIYVDYIQSPLNDIMFDESACENIIPYCPCIPLVPPLMEQYLQNCPSNEIIYVL